MTNYLSKSILSLVVNLFLIYAYALAGLPIKTTKATLGYTTSVHQDLISLPPPKEKIVVAVYKFRDQTGQYKASATGMTWSTAVTQGATSMLLKALEDSGWFIVLEREGLANLLNERKIIRSTRDNYTDAQGKKLAPLPPLLYAGVNLEGGIIAYETNTMTGGFGARYFGLGGHADFRRDQVTIYLRAVATKSGRVLNNVYTTKTILSKAIDLGLYRFVREKRLLEIETGLSTNEPPQMCVLEAIEKAVLSLTIDGILSKNWELKNPQDIKSPVIQNYLQEKENLEKFAQFDKNGKDGYTNYSDNKGFGLTVNFGSQLYQGDYAHPKLTPAGDIALRYGLSRHFSLALNACGGKLGNKDNFSTELISVQLEGLFTPWPKHRFRPFIFGGGGGINFRAKDNRGIRIKRDKGYWGWEPILTAGAGLEYFLVNNLSMSLSFDNHYSFTDKLDGVYHGKYDDYFWGIRLGLTYY